MKLPRRSVLVVGGGAVTVVLAVVAAVGLGGGGGVPVGDPEPGSTTVDVALETLVDAITVDGHVGYGPAAPLQTVGEGTLTWLVPVGTVVNRGDVLLRVDDQPVVLFLGMVPEYRDLSIGTTGNDVRQMEENLVALGYAFGLTVDETFTPATADAVRAWQHDLGVAPTGSVPLGAVHIEPAPVRVSEHLVRPGAAAGGEALSTTGTSRLVEADLDQDSSAWVAREAPVEIVLPNGHALPGSIVDIGYTTDDETSTVHVVIAVSDQEALASVDRGPVTVRHVVTDRRDVLTVPVSALVALAEGGYGLEVVDGTGSHYVAVTVGLFADGRVEVSGPGVVEGLTVRVP